MAFSTSIDIKTSFHFFKFDIYVFINLELIRLVFQTVNWIMINNKKKTLFYLPSTIVITLDVKQMINVQITVKLWNKSHRIFKQRSSLNSIIYISSYIPSLITSILTALAPTANFPLIAYF